MNDIQSRIEVLRPKAGDTIAIHVDARWLTRDQHEQIYRHFSGLMPDGVKVAVLDSTINLSHVVASAAAQELFQAAPIHFDTWMRERAERAHRDFMERTSRRLPCDANTEDVARYMGAQL